jgi:hypothetical protein
MENSVNAWDGLKENLSDFDSAEIPGGKHEHSGAAGSQRRDLQRTISQSLILGQDHPASLTYRLKPNAIIFVASEMVVVNFDN